MKKGFYSKIALQNLINNKRFYVPRILAGTGLLGCFYICYTLTVDKRLSEGFGGNYIPSFMSIGMAVLSVLSTVIMLYINSFLMKQRKREYGLYNVLGMEKRHVGKVMLCETVFSGLVTIALGLCFGMLFYKACSLLICHFLHTDIVLDFYFITPKTLVPSALVFAVLDILCYIINRITLHRLNPIDLLHGVQTAEQEPKVKLPMLIIGLLTLGGGYAIALSVESPLKAITYFFVAVFLVIIGTYCLFVTGSTWVLKTLKKNKKYYYRKNHMPAVAGLLFRMKQNAVGLASIALLATGVLVMISTTVSLYVGTEQTLQQNYPQHLYLNGFYSCKNGDKVNVPADVLIGIAKSASEKCGAKVKTAEYQRYFESTYLFENGMLITDQSRKQSMDLNDLTSFMFITEDTYEYLTGKTFNLKGNEIALTRISSGVNEAVESYNSITAAGREFTVAATPLQFPIRAAMISIQNVYGVVVKDEQVLDLLFQDQKQAYGKYASDYINRVAITYEDEAETSDAGKEICTKIDDAVFAYCKAQPDYEEYSLQQDSIWQAREDVVGMYGCLLFLGIILGFVCLFATVLIIYYKQISEGYDDRPRFQIMEKIGMSPKEVKKAISSQIVLQFFLPVIVAGVHIAFAFPILTKLLRILLLSSTWLFAGCTVAVFAVFVLIYTVIYILTAKTYYKIVH